MNWPKAEQFLNVLFFPQAIHTYQQLFELCQANFQTNELHDWMPVIQTQAGICNTHNAKAGRRNKLSRRVLLMYLFLFINYKQAVMNNKQIAYFFDRFYNIAIKDKIQDPLVHSQWTYFQTMFASTTLEKDRVNMYLSILEKDKEKRKKDGIPEYQLNSFHYEPRMEKRLSEPVKSNTNKEFINFQTNQQDYACGDFAKKGQLATPKSKEGQIKKIGAWESKDKQINSSTSKNKASDTKVNYRKLCQIANNLVRLFQISVID